MRDTVDAAIVMPLSCACRNAILCLLAFANVFLFARAGMLDVGGVTSAALDVLHRVTAHLNISEVTRPLNPNP